MAKRRKRKPTAYQTFRRTYRKSRGKASKVTASDIKVSYQKYLKKKEESGVFGPSISIERFAREEAKSVAAKERRYETYQREYAKAAAKAERNGVDIDKMMTEKQFESFYQATKNEYQYEVEKGQRATVGAVTRDVAQAQINWSMTQKQARAAAEAASDLGIDVSYKDLRAGKGKSNEFWDLIREANRDADAKGWTKKDKRDFISQSFFGSK